MTKKETGSRVSELGIDIRHSTFNIQTATMFNVRIRLNFVLFGEKESAIIRSKMLRMLCMSLTVYLSLRIYTVAVATMAVQNYPKLFHFSCLRIFADTLFAYAKGRMSVCVCFCFSQIKSCNERKFHFRQAFHLFSHGSLSISLSLVIGDGMAKS